MEDLSTSSTTEVLLAAPSAEALTRRARGFVLCLLFLALKLLVSLETTPGELAARLLLVSVTECVSWVLLFSREHRPAGDTAVSVAFPLTAAIYTIIPQALLSLELPVFPFSEEAISKALLLESSYLSLLWVGIFAAIPGWRFQQARMATVRLLTLTVDRSRRHMAGFTAAGAAIAVLYLYVYVASGVRDMPDMSRLETMQQLEHARLWLLQYLMTAWIMALVLASFGVETRRAFRPSHVLVIGAALLTYLYVYISLGNRRELLAVLVFAGALGALRGYLKRTAIVAACLLPLGLLLGVLRGGEGASVDLDRGSSVVNAVGEFVFPHFPLVDAVETQPPLEYGTTYLTSFVASLPTFGVWEKQPTLALAFSQDFADGLMGYAYTPLTEGYRNFGSSAVLIVPFGIACVFGAAVRAARRRPLLLLLLVALSLDISRGELAPLAVQIVIYWTSLALFIRLLALGAERE